MCPLFPVVPVRVGIDALPRRLYKKPTCERPSAPPGSLRSDRLPRPMRIWLWSRTGSQLFFVDVVLPHHIDTSALLHLHRPHWVLCINDQVQLELPVLREVLK